MEDEEFETSEEVDSFVDGLGDLGEKEQSIVFFWGEVAAPGSREGGGGSGLLLSQNPRFSYQPASPRTGRT